MSETKETMSRVAALVKGVLDSGGLGPFTVSVRTTDGSSRYFIDEDGDPKSGKLGLNLIIQNEGAEVDPIKYKAYIAERLGTLAPLVPYIDFTLPEPEKDHLQHLADRFENIRAKAMTAGLTISDAYGDWLKERAKLAALQETTSEHVEKVHGHAIRIDRNDNFITATFLLSTGVNAGEVQKDIDSRAAAIKSLLARMTAKKLSQDPAEQAIIIEQVKALDMVVTTQSYGSGYNNVNIEFRSPKVTAAMKSPGGLTALKEEDIKALKESNPLMRLKDGDGLTPENPSDLKKALARAILFEGEKGEKPIALFPRIAGPKDVKAAIEKTLKYIKNAKPELAADVDALLQDKLFENHSYWARNTKNPDGTPKKERIEIKKLAQPNYVEGQLNAEMSIPADKFPEVLNQLAALAPATPDVQLGAVLPPDQQQQAMMEAINKVVAANTPALAGRA